MVDEKSALFDKFKQKYSRVILSQIYACRINEIVVIVKAFLSDERFFNAEKFVNSKVNIMIHPND